MTTQRARRLRLIMTDTERKLWNALRNRQLHHAKFRRQVPIGPYVADFLSREHNLVIEVDGSQHGGPRDALRDKRLAELGFRTPRFWNIDVLTNLEGVLEAIFHALEETKPPSPRPSPHGGEGEEKHCPKNFSLSRERADCGGLP